MEVGNTSYTMVTVFSWLKGFIDETFILCAFKTRMIFTLGMLNTDAENNHVQEQIKMNGSIQCFRLCKLLIIINRLKMQRKCKCMHYLKGN